MPALQALAAVPSFGGQLGQALGGGISQGISSSINQMLQEKQQKKTGTALAEYLGKPEMADAISKLPYEIQLEVAKGHIKQNQEKQIEKQQSLQHAADTLDRIESLIPESGIGMSGSINFSDKAVFNRGEFSSLQASLIPLFKQMFPRMTNYDLKIIQDNYIPNSHDREETIRGKIQGLRQMLQTGELPKELTNGTEKKEKAQFNPQNPEHKDRALKLHKALKDKEKVRAQLQKEFRFDVS